MSQLSLPCLEVRVAGRVIAVPVDSISIVAEFPVTPPPPLARPEIGGLVKAEREIATLIDLGLHRATERRTQKCLLFERGRSRSRLALAVDSIGSMLHVRLQEDHPGWLRPALDEQGRALEVFDIERATQDLEGLEEGARA